MNRYLGVSLGLIFVLVAALNAYALLPIKWDVGVAGAPAYGDADTVTGVFNEAEVTVQTSTVQFDTNNDGILSVGDKFTDSGDLRVGNLLADVIIDKEGLNQLFGYEVTAQWNNLEGYVSGPPVDLGNGETRIDARYTSGTINLYLDPNLDSLFANPAGTTPPAGAGGTNFTEGVLIATLELKDGVGHTFVDFGGVDIKNQGSVEFFLEFTYLLKDFWQDSLGTDLLDLVGSGLVIAFVDMNINTPTRVPGVPEGALFTTYSNENGSMSIELVPQQIGACRMTHGSVTVNQDNTFELLGAPFEVEMPVVDNPDAKGNSWKTVAAPWYNWSGQIGAPQANDSSYGEMQLNQHDHPLFGSFAFHAGTNSATKPQTEISSVACSDPGWCENARCAPFKQIFWDGVGEFQNIKNNIGWENICAVSQKSGKGKNGQSGTFHYFKAHAADFGEPAGNFPPGEGPQPSEELCQDWTSGGVDIADTNFITGPTGVFPPLPGAHHGNKGSQECQNCPDYFEIEIHCTEDPNSPVIYQVHDFIDRGNIQIHPEVGSSCGDYF